MGHWMIRVSEEEIERKTPDAVLVRKVLQFLKPYANKLYLLVALILFGTITATAGPYILSLVINSAIYSKDFQSLLSLSIVYFGIQLLD